MPLLDDFQNGLGNIYGQGGPGDPLIALGMGLLSQRGLARGMAAGIGNMGAMAEMANRRKDVELQRQRQATLDKMAADREARQAANDAFMQKLNLNKFGLEQKQFDLAQQQANKPQLAEVPTGDAGQVQKQWIAPGQSVGVPVGAPSIPTSEKATEAQSNAALFARRIAAANDILNNPEIWQSGLGKAGVGAKIAEHVPIVGNMMLPKEYQQLRQAQEDFLGAVLRKESGAAISAGEYEHGNRQYFPQPGDSPEVIAQKEANRKTALTGILGAASPAFQKSFTAEREAAKTANPALAQPQQPQTGVSSANPPYPGAQQFPGYGDRWFVKQNGKWMEVVH